MSIINKTIYNAIAKAVGNESAKTAELRAATDKEIQKAVDAVTVACKVSKKEFLKGNSKTNEARAEIKSMFETLFPSQESAARNYATSFWISFEKAIPFQRDLFSQAKTKAKGTGKTGPTVTTNLDAVAKTIAKAIQQARLLEMDDLAAALLDVGQEYIEYEFE